MALYRARFSTNVERVALALAHKGLEVRSVWIEYDDRSPVERVSGQSLVPVLEFDDGAVVFDSMQIVRVLEERHPQPPLYPPDAAGRARMIHFIDWFNHVWKTLPSGIEAEIGRDAPDVARIDELASRMQIALGAFETMLADRAYLMGDGFSAADCAVYPFLKYALGRDPADDELFHRVLEGYQRLDERHERLAAWIERVGERPRV
jgi:maleylacetoacetate isomerase